MGKPGILDSPIARALAVFVAGSTVSFWLAARLMVSVWDASQTAAAETSKRVEEHSAEISALNTRQAVIVEKLAGIEVSLKEFRADFRREVERGNR